MYKTSSEAVNLVQKLVDLVEDVQDVDIVVCPPFTALKSVATVLQFDKPNIELGAQNMYWEDEGAYTGEVSPIMLKELNVKYVIIGHSERRGYFGENDEVVNKKVEAAIAHKLTPIMCVGESLEERENEKTQEVVRKQIFDGLKGSNAEDVEKIVIAYEPIWAIGTGRSATAQDANDVIRHIRALIGSQFGQEVAKEVRIQYGGSVKPKNINEFMGEPDIDGALVGGASLEAESFARIVKYDRSSCRA
jgi:triosephosphate isomerase